MAIGAVITLNRHRVEPVTIAQAYIRNYSVDLDGWASSFG